MIDLQKVAATASRVDLSRVTFLLTVCMLYQHVISFNELLVLNALAIFIDSIVRPKSIAIAGETSRETAFQSSKRSPTYADLEVSERKQETKAENTVLMEPGESGPKSGETTDEIAPNANGDTEFEGPTIIGKKKPAARISSDELKSLRRRSK
jgi:hypothetical protein